MSECHDSCFEIHILLYIARPSVWKSGFTFSFLKIRLWVRHKAPQVRIPETETVRLHRSRVSYLVLFPSLIAPGVACCVSVVVLQLKGGPVRTGDPRDARRRVHAAVVEARRTAQEDLRRILGQTEPHQVKITGLYSNL